MEFLDTTTPRFAYGVVALSLLELFYFVTFRRTRSVYSASWCAALALFLAGWTSGPALSPGPAD